MDMEVKSNIHFTSHILLNVVRERGVILEEIRGKRETNVINEREKNNVIYLFFYNLGCLGHATPY
jgi:hypothetical protein